MVAVLAITPTATIFAQPKITPADADAQITGLADKIEQELLSQPTMPSDIALTFQQAVSLLPHASDTGKKLLTIDLPKRLRADANDRKEHSDVEGNLAKAINLTVVADFISGETAQTAVSQLPPPKSAPPTAVTPAVRQPPPPSISTAKPVDQGLVQRGDVMLSQGNIEAARMLYERAANDGVGAAALKLGETYDPRFIASHHLIGPKPDPQQAEAWYRKASALGEAEAAQRLKLMADKE